MVQNKNVKIAAIFLFFSLFVTGIQIVGNPAINYSIKQAPEIDGVINLGEYNSTKSFSGGNYELYWELISDTSISFGITAKTTGWVAIGFDPTTQMLDADIVFAWVDGNGSVIIIDAISLVPTGSNHPADTDRSGTDDIIESDGSENATHTTVEFSRLLSTGDSNDNDIPINGELDIIWAYGSSDSFSEYHGGARGSSTITIGVSLETTTSTASLTTTTSGSAPGFQGFFLLFSITTFIIIYRKR